LLRLALRGLRPRRVVFSFRERRARTFERAAFCMSSGPGATDCSSSDRARRLAGRACLALIFFCAFFSPRSGLAQANESRILFLNGARGSYPLGEHLFILRDKSGNLEFADVLKPENADKFQPAGSEAPSFGFTDDAFWLRLRIKDDSGHEHWLLEIAYPLLQNIDLYLPASDGSYYHKRAGESLLFHERDAPHRNFVFELTTRKGSVDTIYIRIRTESSVIMPVHIWERTAFAAKDHDEQLALGIYYGIVSIMVMYNFFLFLSLRDKIYLAYVVSTAAYILFQAGLNGLSYEYLWPNSPQWNGRSLPFLIGLVALTTLMFTSLFLNVRRLFPRLYAWFRLLEGTSVAVALLSLFAPYGLCIRFGVGLAIAATLTMIGAGLISLRRKFKPARFFLIGWSVFLLGQLISALHKGYGLFPTNALTLYCGQFGSAWEAVLLALALADRINLIQEERYKAREAAFNALRQTDELNEKLREANRTLEQNVGERTAALREANRKLREMDRLKSDFLANVSHELRTPLTSVIGFAQIIKQRFGQEIAPRFPVSDPSFRNVGKIGAQLDIIVAEGERLTRLINDVLDLAKLEADRIVWNMEPVSIEDVVKAAVRATQPLFQQKGLAVRVEPASEQLPEVYADSDRIMQVCINLLSNAIKFTEQGEVVSSMHRERIQGEDSLVVSVRDSGTGVPPEALEDIFDKFKQVGDTLIDKPKGTGLGLPISKQIVERHGGRIWVESELGRGSVFRFSLPLRPASGGEEAQDELPQKTAEPVA
jgi:signal transduction histidine kinase